MSLPPDPPLFNNDTYLCLKYCLVVLDHHINPLIGNALFKCKNTKLHLLKVYYE